MNTEVYWTAIGTIGLEHLVLQDGKDGIQADGQVLRRHDGQGLRIGYHIRCDPGWRTRQVSVQLTGIDKMEMRLSADGSGHWNGPAGERLKELEGCLDMDIMATPFTNTLAIRRLGLAVGESAEIDAAYLSIPELSLSRARQRYTCLEQKAGGGRYLYESLDGDFKAELKVDEDGLVLDYEGVWARAV